jgi:hypothetical protein
MAHTTKFLTVLALLVAALVQPVSAAPTSRTTSIGYDGPNGLVVSSSNADTKIFTVQTGKVDIETGEQFVSAKITDDSGDPVAAEVHQGGAELGVICGDGSEELILVNKKPVHLHLQFGAATDCGGASLPSSGTIELTFSR